MLAFMHEDRKNGSSSLVTHGINRKCPKKIFFNDESMDISEGPGLYNVEPMLEMDSYGFVIGDRVQPAPISNTVCIMEALHDVIKIGCFDPVHRLSFIKKAKVKGTGDVIYYFQLEHPVTGLPTLAGWAYRDLLYKNPNEIQIELVPTWSTQFSDWTTDAKTIHTDRACAEVTSWVADSVETSACPDDLIGQLPEDPLIYQMKSGYIICDKNEPDYHMVLLHDMAEGTCIRYQIPTIALFIIGAKYRPADVTDIVLTKICKSYLEQFMDTPPMRFVMKVVLPDFTENLSAKDVKTFRVFRYSGKIIGFAYLDSKHHIIKSQRYVFRKNGAYSVEACPVPYVFVDRNRIFDITDEVITWLRNRAFYHSIMGPCVVGCPLNNQMMEATIDPAVESVLKAGLMVTVHVEDGDYYTELPFWMLKKADKINELPLAVRKSCDDFIRFFEDRYEKLYIKAYSLIKEGIH